MASELATTEPAEQDLALRWCLEDLSAAIDALDSGVTRFMLIEPWEPRILAITTNPLIVSGIFLYRVMDLDHPLTRVVPLYAGLSGDVDDETDAAAAHWVSIDKFYLVMCELEAGGFEGGMKGYAADPSGFVDWHHHHAHFVDLETESEELATKLLPLRGPTGTVRSRHRMLDDPDYPEYAGVLRAWEGGDDTLAVRWNANRMKSALKGVAVEIKRLDRWGMTHDQEPADDGELVSD